MRPQSIGGESPTRRGCGLLRFIALLCVLGTGIPHLDAQTDDSVRVRVVDVGPGLCTVTRVPGGHYMVYDAGHWNGQFCVRAVRELVLGDGIDLLILSHSDSDHLGDGARILSEYGVRHIIWTGDPRWDTGTWRGLNEAVAEEVRHSAASVRSLVTVPLVPGERLQLGAATVTLVAGWGQWTEPGPTASERRNAISIVVRLDYGDTSVLYTGDTVGRRLDDPDVACKDAEKFMADNHDAGLVPITADVLIAPHHGGNNGSALCFIERVAPRFVVFSAGHDHQHPTGAAAGRLLAGGVPPSRIFRTDRGDHEAGPFEWREGRVPGCRSPRGHDDVEITLPPVGAATVRYLRPQHGC